MIGPANHANERESSITDVECRRVITGVLGEFIISSFAFRHSNLFGSIRVIRGQLD
jgi:hypothetical protein